MKVNFLDLGKQYNSIKDEVHDAMDKVFESTAFTGGKFVEEFENSFADAHNANYCIAVNNGTSALHALLMALDIGPGDEIIIPTNTFFATPQAVSLCGALPVFVDCENTYYNIDPDKVEQAITENTKAIFAVHLYGQPAQMNPLKDIADRHNIHLLEDCAQAHLAQYDGKFIGTIGKAGCFSFYPGKNLGAFGEGGAIITNDSELADKLRKIRNHGSEIKYYHDYIGHNFRMAGLQGAILNVKLKHLPGWTNTRIERAKQYSETLAGISDIVTPQTANNVKHVFHLYVILAPRRDELMKYLSENDIYSGLHYPIPCHLQKAYESLGYEIGDFKVAEELSTRMLSLPMSDQLTESEAAFVCEKIINFYT